MSAALPEPLAPVEDLDNDSCSLHNRYYMWYKILVVKLHRRCRNARYYVQQASEARKAVKKSLDAWKEAFKVLFKRAWVNRLNEKQLEDII